MRRAIISSYSKDEDLLGLASLCRKNSIELFSTAGTAEFLNKNGVPCSDLGSITGFKSLANERVKTLSPVIYEAVLSKHDVPGHPLEGLEFVFVDLYPFPARGRFSDNIELIDIGGITLLRAAAKNHERVLPFFEYEDAFEYLENGADRQKRMLLSKKTFYYTSYYDSLIANSAEGDFPPKFTLAFDGAKYLKYGENPHQKGIYARIAASEKSLADIAVLENKKSVSYNNFLDAYHALWTLKELKNPAVCIVKHGNPIGVAETADLSKSFELAYNTEPDSAFGGIAAFNRPLDKVLMEKLREYFFEAVIVPPGSSAELAGFFEKRKNIRIFEGDPLIDFQNTFRGFGGMTLFNEDRSSPIELDFRTGRENSSFTADIEFGLAIMPVFASNSIIIVKGRTLLGSGAGFPNRIDALKRAIEKAKEKARGAVLVSDGFFPFSDSIDLAATAGIACIVEPGGSLKDKDVVAAAEKHGICLVFTGKRMFRH